MEMLFAIEELANSLTNLGAESEVFLVSPPFKIQVKSCMRQVHMNTICSSSESDVAGSRDAGLTLPRIFGDQ